MFRVDSNSNIAITRGDTGVLSINLTNKDGTEYVMQSGDVLVMTVKQSTRTKDVILQKTFADGQIKINPADTEQLSYGDYVYDIKLTTAANEVFTVITPHKFTIAEEVTWIE